MEINHYWLSMPIYHWDFSIGIHRQGFSMEIHHHNVSHQILLVCIIQCVCWELGVLYLLLFCFEKNDYDCMSTLVFYVRCHNVFEWSHCVWCCALCCVCVQCECSHFVIIVRLCAMVRLAAFIEYVPCHRNPIHRAQYVNVSGCLCGSFIYIRRRACLLPRYFQKEPYHHNQWITPSGHIACDRYSLRIEHILNVVVLRFWRCASECTSSSDPECEHSEALC